MIGYLFSHNSVLYLMTRRLWSNPEFVLSFHCFVFVSHEAYFSAKNELETFHWKFISFNFTIFPILLSGFRVGCPIRVHFLPLWSGKCRKFWSFNRVIHVYGYTVTQTTHHITNLSVRPESGTQKSLKKLWHDENQIRLDAIKIIKTNMII